MASTHSADVCIPSERSVVWAVIWRGEPTHENDYAFAGDLVQRRKDVITAAPKVTQVDGNCAALTTAVQSWNFWLTASGIPKIDIALNALTNCVAQAACAFWKDLI